MSTFKNAPDSLFARMTPDHNVGRSFTRPRGAAVLELLKDAPLSEKGMFRSLGKEPGDPRLEAFRQFSTFSFPRKKNLLARFSTIALPDVGEGMKALIEPQEPDNNDWWLGLLGIIALATILGVALAHGHVGW